jgi:DNA processing protein
LTRFADHPACAFYGFGADVPDPRRPVVAIVGSREAGPALLERTASLARRLAKAGAVVVSGGASGIDAAAHHGAADANGDVVIISGRPIAGRVEVPIDVRHDARLCWLTPYGPWSSGVPHGRFAQRNAFIAAMADVTIAVCGGPRAGTRHTVDAALLFRRPVVTLAPCSSQPDLASIATRLVATGAGDVVDDDITLDALLLRSVSEGAHANWVNDAQPGLPFPPGGSSSLSSSSSLAPDTLAHPLLRLLGARGALTIDDAAAALQSSVRELMVEVALLELDGALRRDGAVLRVSALVTSRGEG